MKWAEGYFGNIDCARVGFLFIIVLLLPTETFSFNGTICASLLLGNDEKTIKKKKRKERKDKGALGVVWPLGR